MLKAKSWWIWSDENRGRGKGSFSLTTKLEVYIIWTANPKVVRSNTHTFRTFRTKCTRTKAICRNGRCKFPTIQSSYRFRSFTWVFLLQHTHTSFDPVFHMADMSSDRLFYGPIWNILHIWNTYKPQKKWKAAYATDFDLMQIFFDLPNAAFGGPLPTHTHTHSWQMWKSVVDRAKHCLASNAG